MLNTGQYCGLFTPALKNVEFSVLAVRLCSIFRPACPVTKLRFICNVCSTSSCIMRVITIIIIVIIIIIITSNMQDKVEQTVEIEQFAVTGQPGQKIQHLNQQAWKVCNIESVLSIILHLTLIQILNSSAPTCAHRLKRKEGVKCKEKQKKLTYLALIDYDPAISGVRGAKAVRASDSRDPAGPYSKT